MSTEADHNRRGLIKLMLRVPALRGRLQIIVASNDDVFSLCGAFEDASSTLERLRRGELVQDRQVIAEYENICSEIEREIIAICGR